MAHWNPASGGEKLEGLSVRHFTVRPLTQYVPQVFPPSPSPFLGCKPLPIIEKGKTPRTISLTFVGQNVSVC